MSARDRILGRLRGASPAPQPLPEVGNWYTSHSREEEISHRIARLRGILESVHTEVHSTSADEWPDLLLKIAKKKGVRILLVGDDTPHGKKLEEHSPSSLDIVRYAAPVDSWCDQLFDSVDASLTLARSAIAETGSLILWPSAAEPRLMSLVPPVHFVLLDVANIHADFYSAITAEGWGDAMPTNALLISGPSKTADIQQTLAYGAHGPRELVVLLCHPTGEIA
jgi:L-lactate dehydrogenase complex protein LldG